jgi:hypothetical protein
MTDAYQKLPKVRSRIQKPDCYDAISDAVADVARLAAQVENPTRNILGVTIGRLDTAKRKLAELMRSAGQ